MRLVKMMLKQEITSHGVRRIPINVRSLTGEVNGQEFESSLERDLLLLIHWDHNVDWYQSQPVTINYQDETKKNRTYTPDLLLHFRKEKVRRGASPIVVRKPILGEVKYREDIAKDWQTLKPKFKAARRYAKEQGWEFRVFTEKEIRTPYLKNIQFLWAYKFAHFHEHHFDRMMYRLAEMGETDPRSLLETTYQSETQRGEAMWTLWCMVARRLVECDLEQPLTMKTRIKMDVFAK